MRGADLVMRPGSGGEEGDHPMKPLRCLAVAAALGLAACTPAYTLVPPAPTVAAQGAIRVHPARAWNRLPRAEDQLPWEENWTQNGPVLDMISFIGGLPDGEALIRQRRKENRKVPVFRAGMTPPDLVSMIESYYRVKAGVTLFNVLKVEPAAFLGVPGLQLDYGYVGEDNVKRRGRMRFAVIGRKLYLMVLEASALHYFDAALPDFEAMARTATRG